MFFLFCFFFTYICILYREAAAFRVTLKLAHTFTYYFSLLCLLECTDNSEAQGHGLLKTPWLRFTTVVVPEVCYKMCQKVADFVADTPGLDTFLRLFQKGEWLCCVIAWGRGVASMQDAAPKMRQNIGTILA